MGGKITSNGGSRDPGTASAEQAGGVRPLDPAEFGEHCQPQGQELAYVHVVVHDHNRMPGS